MHMDERANALAVVDECQWVTLAMTDEEGTPYCVPLHVVREGDWLYFHCGSEGEKLRYLRANPQVCLSAVGGARVIQQGFTTAYTSAVVRGTAEEITGQAEKIDALRLICLRFTPEAMGRFDQALAAWLGRTGIWRIHIDGITGKRKTGE